MSREWWRDLDFEALKAQEPERADELAWVQEELRKIGRWPPFIVFIAMRKRLKKAGNVLYRGMADA